MLFDYLYISFSTSIDQLDDKQNEVHDHDYDDECPECECECDECLECDEAEQHDELIQLLLDEQFDLGSLKNYLVKMIKKIEKKTKMMLQQKSLQLSLFYSYYEQVMHYRYR